MCLYDLALTYLVLAAPLIAGMHISRYLLFPLVHPAPVSSDTFPFPVAFDPYAHVSLTSSPFLVAPLPRLSSASPCLPVQIPSPISSTLCDYPIPLPSCCLPPIDFQPPPNLILACLMGCILLALKLLQVVYDEAPVVAMPFPLAMVGLFLSSLYLPPSSTAHFGHRLAAWISFASVSWPFQFPVSLCTLLLTPAGVSSVYTFR